MDKNIIWTFDNLELEKRMTGPVNQTLNLINTELCVNINHIPNHFLYLVKSFHHFLFHI